jgi:hypothetical protein
VVDAVFLFNVSKSLENIFARSYLGFWRSKQVVLALDCLLWRRLALVS